MEKIREFCVDGVHAVHITDTPRISLFKTFDCGQCFRFDTIERFDNKIEVGGVAHGKYVIFAQNHENELIIYNSTEDDYWQIWRKYLSLDVDYDKVNAQILRQTDSPHMQRALEYGNGIRILRQEPYEAIISFIISQNNNIPRIKKIIASICQNYGHSVALFDKIDYTFPSNEELSQASEQELFSLRMGFRAKYIADACEKIKNGSVDIEGVMASDDFDACVAHLCQIKGIGLKVASCALLFGFGKTEAFPRDVHINRTLEKYFPNGIDVQSLGKSAGIAQQYLFYYEKYSQST